MRTIHFAISKAFLCLFISVLIIQNNSAQYTWKQKTGFPGSGRSGAVSFVIGNNAYVGLGYDGDTVKNDFWRYNITGDSWTQIADFEGSARESAVAFVINDTAYVGTGDNGYPVYEKLKDFWKYNVGTNTWKRISDFGGTARTGAACFSIQGKGYVATGIDNSDEQKDIWEYNPQTDTWTKKADLTGDKRKDAVGFSINGKGYLCSGWYFDSYSMVLNDVQEYNPVTDSWTEKIFADNLLSKKQYAGCFILDNKAYLVSGNNNNSVVVYDPVSNDLTTETAFGPTGENNRNLIIAFSIENKAFAGLGYLMESMYDLVYKNDFWAFTAPSLPEAPSSLDVTVSTYNHFNFTWKDNSDNETSFELEHSVGNKNNYHLASAIQSNKTSYNYGSSATIDTAVYFFRIRAKNSLGYSTYSNVDSVITYAGKQTGLIALAYSINQIELYWNDDSKSEEGFYIERSENDADHFVRIDSIPPSEYNPSYIDKNVKEGVVYYYKVAARYGNVNKYSNTDFASPYEQGTWTRIFENDNISQPGVAFYRDSVLYFGLGKSDKMWAYDYMNDSITEKKSLTGKNIFGKNSLKIGNKGYIFYGSDVNTYLLLNELWEYDFETDIWTKKNSIDDTSRIHTSCFSIGDKAYLTGGHKVTYSGNSFTYGNPTNEVWEYNSTNNTWTKRSPFPGGNVSGVPAFSSNGKGYLLYNYNELWEFTPGSNEWQKIKTFPFKIVSTSGIGVDSSFYFFGYDYDSKKMFYEYNIAKDSVIKRTLFQEDIYPRVYVNSEEKLILGGDNFGTVFFEYNLLLPQGPTDLSANALNYTEIELKWTDNSNIESKYYIERYLCDSYEPGYFLIDSADANSISYIDKNAVKNKKYYYRVRAKNDKGYSNYSNETYAQTDVPIIPELCKVLPVFNATTAEIVWMKYIGGTDGTIGFVLERSEGQSPQNFVVIDTFINKHDYTDINLTPGKLYYYRLKSYNNIGNSGYSTVIKAVAGALCMQDGTFKVSENTYFDYMGYNIIYDRCFSQTQTIMPLKEDDKTTLDFKEFDIYAGDTLIVYDGTDANSPVIDVFTTLNKPGSLIYAKNASGSLTLKFISPCKGYNRNCTGWMAKIKSYPVIPPSNLKAQYTGDKDVLLTWNDNTDDEYYFILERSVHDSLHFEVLDSTISANETNYTDTSFNTAYTYFYRLKSKGEKGYSDYSEMIKVNNRILGIDKNTMQEDFLVYPNPADGIVHIKYNSQVNDRLVISLTDGSGRTLKRLLREVQYGSNNFELDISELSKGLYHIGIQNSNRIFWQTIVKI
ncbi:MAG: kelch repeat-containing protein [Bacteroidales bacterium]